MCLHFLDVQFDCGCKVLLPQGGKTYKLPSKCDMVKEVHDFYHTQILRYPEPESAIPPTVCPIELPIDNTPGNCITEHKSGLCATCGGIQELNKISMHHTAENLLQLQKSGINVNDLVFTIYHWQQIVDSTVDNEDQEAGISVERYEAGTATGAELLSHDTFLDHIQDLLKSTSAKKSRKSRSGRKTKSANPIAPSLLKQSVPLPQPTPQPSFQLEGLPEGVYPCLPPSWADSAVVAGIYENGMLMMAPSAADSQDSSHAFSGLTVTSSQPEVVAGVVGAPSAPRKNRKTRTRSKKNRIPHGLFTHQVFLDGSHDAFGSSPISPSPAIPVSSASSENDSFLNFSLFPKRQGRVRSASSTL